MNWIKRLNKYGVSNGVILLLFVLSFFSMLAQMVGLGIFLPIFEFVIQNDTTQLSDGSQNLLLNYINLIIKSLGLSLTLESLLIVAFFFYLVSQISLFIIASANAYFLGRMTKTIRDRFFEYYLDADSEYYDQVKIGDFINISTTELGSATLGVIAPIKLMVQLISALGSIFILLMLSYELTFYIVLIVLLMLPYPMILISRTTKAGRENTEFNSNLVSFILDRLRSPRLVRLSGTRNSEIREYSVITEKQRNLTFKIHLLKEKIGLTFEPSIVFSALVVLYIAVTYLGMSASSIILFMVITIRLVPIIRALLIQKQAINRSKGPIESIDALLLEMKTKETQGNFVKVYPESGNIQSINSVQLENVSYRYSKFDSDAISNISLVFNKESINAIIGPSGSGKSTLIDIISTYRKPNSGMLLLDGSSYTGSDINNLISYVPQDPQIFDGEIINHISYGFDNKQLDEIKNAAMLSGAHDFMMKLEDGYQTVLNNNGDNLSGGQRYRVDMARALLSDAPILILDEPTSALDYENKAYFIKNLKKIKADTRKIIVVITHDFSIMPIFDSIVLMTDGELVSQSNHNYLLGNNSWYRDGFKNSNGGEIES
jgi:ABC-type multidrug transport system fused ATPase/permease subunit